jgi:hypothetical protein
MVATASLRSTPESNSILHSFAEKDTDIERPIARSPELKTEESTIMSEPQTTSYTHLSIHPQLADRVAACTERT